MIAACGLRKRVIVVNAAWLERYAHARSLTVELDHNAGQYVLDIGVSEYRAPFDEAVA